MIRNRITNDGKFFLRRKAQNLFLYESGTAYVGTPDETPYCNWTRWPSTALGFKTVKAARAMKRKLAMEGIAVVIVNRDMQVVE